MEVELRKMDSNSSEKSDHEVLVEEPKVEKSDHEVLVEEPKVEKSDHEVLVEEPKVEKSDHEVLVEEPKVGISDHEVLVEEPKVEKIGITRMWWKVVDVSAADKKMEVQFNVQGGRVVTYSFFIVMNIIAIIITLAKYGGIPEPNIIKTALGANMICLFYDFPPATYVLPPFWAICVVFGSFYALTSVYRARLAQVENQITFGQRIFFNISSIGWAIALIVFSNCLAVQPYSEFDPDNLKVKAKDLALLKIHTYPFTNLMIWLALEQISQVWFGWLSGWTGVDDQGKPIFPQWFKITSIVHVVIQGLHIFIHILYQINGLEGEWVENEDPKGLFIAPKTPAWQTFGSVSGALFLILSFLLPLIQSIYEITRNDRHRLIITISDNKNAKEETKNA